MEKIPRGDAGQRLFDERAGVGLCDFTEAGIRTSAMTPGDRLARDHSGCDDATAGSIRGDRLA